MALVNQTINQLTQFKNLSSWREDNVTINAHETHHLYFEDTTPNMFVVVNPNMATLKIGISSIPLEDNYEFKVEYNCTETLGRPMGTKYLYILNDSSIDVTIRVFSIADIFNVEILKNLTVNLKDYTIESNAEISGVADGVTLPVSEKNSSNIISALTVVRDNINNLISGSTVSGKTNLSTLKSLLEEIRDKEITVSGGSGSSTSGSTDMTATNDLLTLIKNSAIVTESNTGTLKTQGSNLYALLSKFDELKYTKSEPHYGNNVTDFNYENLMGTKVILVFDWLFNDGGVATLYCDDDKQFTMLSGEAYADLRFELEFGDLLILNSDEPMIRYKYHIETLEG